MTDKIIEFNQYGIPARRILLRSSQILCLEPDTHMVVTAANAWHILTSDEDWPRVEREFRECFRPGLEAEFSRKLREAE